MQKVKTHLIFLNLVLLLFITWQYIIGQILRCEWNSMLRHCYGGCAGRHLCLNERDMPSFFIKHYGILVRTWPHKEEGNMLFILLFNFPCFYSHGHWGTTLKKMKMTQLRIVHKIYCKVAFFFKCCTNWIVPQKHLFWTA